MATNDNDVVPEVQRFVHPLLCLVLAILVISLSIPVASLAAGPQKGDMAPDFSLADMGGTVRTLSEHQGDKVVLLDFWSIYCVSCLQEMPHLIDLYNKYKDQGLQVYGIDLDSFSPKRVQRFIDGLQFKIPYPVIVDRRREIAGSFKVGMLPTTIIIGKDGKIEMVHIGFKPDDIQEFDHLLQDLLD